jgi:TolB-like protein
MAPEQLQGTSVDARTDIYAAGVVLYELAVGQRPFAEMQSAALWNAILHQRPPRPRSLNSQISESLDGVMARALDKEPARRQQSAAELVRDLDPASTPALAPDRRTRRWRAAALMVVAAAALLSVAYFLGAVGPRAAPAQAGKLSIAVLPFHIPQGNEAIRFLGISLPDAIITRLADAPQLLARPTSAVLPYENQRIDPSEAGRALASEYVLTGIAQQTGEQVRISVQLVRARDGALVWGNHYDLSRSDLLALQDQVAPAVADALEIHTSAAERARLFRRYTENARAYEQYLQGRSHLVRYTADEVRQSVQAFEAALRLDPRYAPARAGLAMACALMSLRFVPSGDVAAWSSRAQHEARQALKLDPQLAEAHEALAAVHREVTFDWDQTLLESERALQLNPNLDQPHFYRAAAFYHLGLFDLVEPEVQAGLEVNPANRVDALRMRGVLALMEGRSRDAVALFETLESLNKGTFAYLLAQAYYYAGDTARAESLLRATEAPGNTRAQAILASVLAARGARADAEAHVRAVLRGGYIDHHVAYSLGATYAQLGNAGEANRWLAEAARTGLPCHPWYKRDPLLNRIRGNRDFQRFMEEQRQAWLARHIKYQTGT